MKIQTSQPIFCGWWAAMALVAASSEAQLRIVNYNTTGGPRDGLATVLEAIGEEVVNGLTRPIDVLAVQEQSSSATTTQAIVDLLNAVYGAGVYALATLDGATNGAGRPGLVFNTSTVQVIEQTAFGVVSTAAQARQTLRYRLRPVGYDEAADFYLYSNHYKAGSIDSDRERRDIEATALRNNLDGLGNGTHAILAGDYNIQSSNEASYQTLLAPGFGQAFDPLNRPGNWNDNAAFRAVHTQAPAVAASPGLIGGGMDDRFDFQLVTAELLDGEGLDYLPGSYHAFGNNGTHNINGSIATGNGAAPDVLSALMTASDHLPIVVDYQLPAVLEAFTSTLPTTLEWGQVFQLAVTVSNAAHVVVPQGADELDYSLTASGDLFGSFSGVDAALGSSNIHLLTLDTATLGQKSGWITVTSSSQAAAHPTVTIPIQFAVALSASGDFNGDRAIDAADYVVWRNVAGTPADYTVWQTHFGGTRVATTVPEPGSRVVVLWVVLSLLACRGVRMPS